MAARRNIFKETSSFYHFSQNGRVILALPPELTFTSLDSAVQVVRVIYMSFSDGQFKTVLFTLTQILLNLRY